ncbi:unnamed protein product [Aureobasidium vineae]|uniref:Uncharacterized protein n=1 Tax=Aureobasidium vineae TaxID=2773715 RepID=A0A9N8P7Z0_9PEZI|nr:unnamed protein product [Aureobasidium vineae]
MAHYIADKATKEAVDRVMDQIRSKQTQNAMASVMLGMFQGPTADDKRKELETRIKAELGLGGLESHDSMEERVQAYETKAEELTQRFAAEDAKKMVEACFGVQDEEWGDED